MTYFCEKNAACDEKYQFTGRSKGIGNFGNSAADVCDLQGDGFVCGRGYFLQPCFSYLFPLPQIELLCDYFDGSRTDMDCIPFRAEREFLKEGGI